MYRLIGTRDGEKVYRLVEWGGRKSGVREIRLGMGVLGVGGKEGRFERGERREVMGECFEVGVLVYEC